MTSIPKLLPVVALAGVHLGCVGSAEAAPPAPGPIALNVDASEAPRKIIHAKLILPARPGPMTLYYPQWIPGEHGPTGPIVNLAGLKFTSAGKTIAWRRDPVDMFAFHVEVPAGAKSLDAELDFLSPSANEGFSGGASATSQLVDLSWNQLILYPAGAKHSDDWTVVARLTLPPGWKYATALPVASEAGATIDFKPASLTTLVDSPVIAGAHFRKVDLSPGEPILHELDMVSDSDAALAAPAELLADFGRLVKETGALFGARHYRDYHFLYTLSDHVASFGLEHHESSDDRSPERSLIDEGPRKLAAGLLPHEMVHSWNGKYRRPKGLATADYQQPMNGELLWVYEGLTNYLGEILTARSGLWTEADYREELARTAASLDNRPGRTWRSLADTAIAAQVLYQSPDEWSAWRRSVDFYPEGTLLWLEVDVILRRESKGQRSLDDFCHAFHGGESGPPKVLTYGLDDIVKALNEVVPYDWHKLLTDRLDSTSARAPLGGVTGSGWKLAYNETPNDLVKVYESARKRAGFSLSAGFTLSDDGTVTDVIPDLPAAKAGLAPGMRLIAANGRRYSAEVLREALKAGKTASEPLELLVENGEFFKTLRVDYHGGVREPHLVRDASQPDLLSLILKPRVPPPAPAAQSRPDRSAQ